jgi:hypothetical protein
VYIYTIIYKYVSSHKSGQKVSKESTKPLGFTVSHYFYIYNISSDNSTAI